MLVDYLSPTVLITLIFFVGRTYYLECKVRKLERLLGIRKAGLARVQNPQAQP